MGSILDPDGQSDEDVKHGSSASSPSCAVQKSDTACPSLPTLDSTWIYEEANEPWPVIIIEAPTEHVRTVWAVLLGNYQYVTVDVAKLSEYDPHHDYLKDRACKPSERSDSVSADEEVETEKLRRNAFLRDVPKWGDHIFWMRRIEKKTGIKPPIIIEDPHLPIQRSNNPNIIRKSIEQASPPSLKRSRSPTDDYDFIYDSPAKPGPRKFLKPRADGGIPVNAVATSKGVMSVEEYSALCRKKPARKPDWRVAGSVYGPAAKKKQRVAELEE